MEVLLGHLITSLFFLIDFHPSGSKRKESLLTLLLSKAF
jgi:hypothetical protein